jgi:hypothetical protein
MERFANDELVNVGDKVMLIDDEPNQKLIKRRGFSPVIAFNTIYTIKGFDNTLILTEPNIDGYLSKIRFRKALIKLMDLVIK